MKAFVISLERSLDRRKHVLKELSNAHLDYEIIDAIDGNRLDPRDVTLASSAWLGPQEFTPRVLGCSMSHRKARATIVDAGLQEALILEDDVVLPREITALVEQTKSHMGGAEVVLLHVVSYDPPGLLSRQGAVSLPSGHLMCYPMDLENHWSAGAYLITVEACRRMASSDLSIRASADDWAYFHKQGLLDRVRCVAPLPVAINPRLSSTVRHSNTSWRDYVYNGLERVPLSPIQALLGLRRQRFFRRGSSLGFVDDPSPYWDSGS